MIPNVDSDATHNERKMMSLEQAILEHAGAVRELAAAIRDLATTQEPTKVYEDIASPSTQKEASKTETAPAPDQEKAERREAIDAALAAAAADKAAKQKEAEAKKAAEPAAPPAATTAVDTAVGSAPEQTAGSDAAADLDYTKDVAPALLRVHRAKGPDVLRNLLLQYLPGDPKPKGDKLRPDQYAAIVADAQALVAG
jgi:hypothetical protein